MTSKRHTLLPLTLAVVPVLAAFGVWTSAARRAPTPASTSEPAPIVPSSIPALTPSPTPGRAPAPIATSSATPPREVAWGDTPVAHFDDDVVHDAEEVWRRERVDPVTAPVREGHVRDLFASEDSSDVLLGIECRTSLCRIALDAVLLQDSEHTRKLAGRVGDRAAIVERTGEQVVVLVPAESFDHDTPPRRAELPPE